MDLSLMYPSDWLAAADLKGDTPVTVESVKQEQLQMEDGSKTDKWVLSFVGCTKRVVLNKTNAKLIASSTGERDGDNWVGKQITLYPTQCRAFGETVPCIRVRAPKSGGMR